jgi:vacuolar protein-sorting-associated protein 4
MEIFDQYLNECHMRFQVALRSDETDDYHKLCASLQCLVSFSPEDRLRHIFKHVQSICEQRIRQLEQLEDTITEQKEEDDDDDEEEVEDENGYCDPLEEEEETRVDRSILPLEYEELQSDDDTGQEPQERGKELAPKKTSKALRGWDQVIGLEFAKEALREAIILPLKFPSLFTGDRKPWNGILLYGPPGTGKTMLARACAAEPGIRAFFSVTSADLLSKWQGESEKTVRNLFQKARKLIPSIIFIDEVDALCSDRRDDGESESSRRVKTEFLVQMQSNIDINRGILVIAATNFPWLLDQAIRRRFERRFYIPLQDEKARKEMFRSLGSSSTLLSEDELSGLASKTEGYSGSDIAIVVKSALLSPIRRCKAAKYFQHVKMVNGKEGFAPCDENSVDSIPMTWMDLPAGVELIPPPAVMTDFLASVKGIKPSITQDDISEYEKFTLTFGEDG